MAKQFDPRKVLKQLSNNLLRQFFARRNELTDVAWDTLTETDVQPVFEAWQALPERERLQVQVTLREVNELADPRGLAALGEGINWRCQDRMAEFESVVGRADKAMWVYLNVPTAFEEAARFALADTLATGRYWYKRNGLPRTPQFEVTGKMKESLAAALAGFYPLAQGRGRYCEVEHYRRKSGSDYFFASLDDYPDTRVVFDADGVLRKRPERGAFDNVFVYSPADGTLETFVHGGAKVRRPLEGLFCASVLGTKLGPEQPGEAAYSLEGLKDPGFAFPTHPLDGVAEVRVRRLRLEVSGAPGRRLTLEPAPRDRPDEVYRMIERYLNPQNLPMSAVRIIGAAFTFTFVAEGGAKPRTMTFDIGHPSSSDLKSKPDEMREVGERHLKKWGISRA